MARPQKFRHSREALNDPQVAEKLGRLVLDIEALRQQRKQIDDQIAAAYDAVDDAGFEKKFVRKVVALRAKEDGVRRDEEEGLESYEFAVERGVSLACARRKPSVTPSCAEEKGREAATPNASIPKASSAETREAAAASFDPETGEITDNQESVGETGAVSSADSPAPDESEQDDAVAPASSTNSPDGATKSTEQPTADAKVTTPDADTRGQTGTADRSGLAACDPASAKAVAKTVGQSGQEAVVELPVDTLSNPAASSQASPAIFSRSDVKNLTDAEGDPDHIAGTLTPTRPPVSSQDELAPCEAGAPVAATSRFSSDPYDPGPIPAFLDRRQPKAREWEDA